MDAGSEFILNFFKALVALGVMGIFLAVISIFITYFFDIKNVRGENSHLSTGVGNALLVLHSFFNPGVKPQTEQIIRIRKKRTRVEKGIRGLKELNYDLINIKGYKHIKGKRYILKAFS